MCLKANIEYIILNKIWAWRALQEVKHTKSTACQLLLVSKHFKFTWAGYYLLSGSDFFWKVEIIIIKLTNPQNNSLHVNQQSF